MLYADLYLKKYASTGDNNFEDQFDDKTKEERALIRSSQNGDFMAFKKLQSKYQNIINKSVSQSRLNSVLDYETSQQEALNAFKELTKSFDLTKPNKPSTYYYGTLPKALNKIKYKNKDFTARKSDDLTMKSEPVSTAIDFLKKENGDTEPTPTQISNFIKANLKVGKGITIDNINKIQNYQRKSLSGNDQVGGDLSGNAEKLTLSDITDMDDKTPEKIMEEQMKQKEMEKIIATMNKQDRRVVMSFYGLGQFKTKKANSLAGAAYNGGLNYYEALKAIKSFQKKLEENGLME